MEYHKELMARVIEASESAEWMHARNEWYLSHYYHSDEDLTCVCGKRHLNHIYTIRNRMNANELNPIGSECIKQFNSKELNDVLKIANWRDRKMTIGKYTGFTFHAICEKNGGYVEYLKKNGEKKKYLDLIKYYDFFKLSK